MIDLDNQTNLSIDIVKLEKIANSLTLKDIELIVTDENTMQELNNIHRGKNFSTDVLSFPLDMPSKEDHSFCMPLGSIVISHKHIIDKSKELKHTPQNELSLLFIHGVLHLLGFDHETDNAEMRLKEKELIEKFNLPQSLIIRTEES